MVSRDESGYRGDLENPQWTLNKTYKTLSKPGDSQLSKPGN